MTIYVADANRSSTMEALRDFIRGVKLPRIWLSLSTMDLENQFKRTSIGLLWVLVSFSLFILAKATIFTNFSMMSTWHYFQYLVIGFAVWQFMSSSVSDASNVFTRNAKWIQGSPLPISVFVLRSVTTNLCTAGLLVITSILVGISMADQLRWTVVLAIPAVLLLILNALWIHVFLGLISAYFRDIQQLMNTFMRIAFFMTPILWVPGTFDNARALVAYNPFAHFIALFRGPILYGYPETTSWIVCISLTLLGWALAVVTYIFARYRLVYWL